MFIEICLMAKYNEKRIKARLKQYHFSLLPCVSLCVCVYVRYTLLFCIVLRLTFSLRFEWISFMRFHLFVVYFFLFRLLFLSISNFFFCSFRSAWFVWILMDLKVLLLSLVLASYPPSYSRAGITSSSTQYICRMMCVYISLYLSLCFCYNLLSSSTVCDTSI